MRGCPLISSVNHQNYLMVFTNRDADKAQDLFQTLTRVGPPMGMRFDEPQLAELPNDRTQTFLQGIERQLTPETQMVGGALLPFVVWFARSFWLWQLIMFNVSKSKQTQLLLQSYLFYIIVS